jgi:hypothetical protein
MWSFPFQDTLMLIGKVGRRAGAIADPLLLPASWYHHVVWQPTDF